VTKEREALKMALEALEVANSCVDGYYIPKGKTHLPEIELAITAIKEALAQPEQEPVAWIDFQKEAQQIVESKVLWKRFIDGTPLANDIACWMADFAQYHTTPPQRKPLTDEELFKLWDEDVSCDMPDTFTQFKHTARAIEAAHGIKGEA